MTPFFQGFLVGFVVVPIFVGLLIWLYVRVVSGRQL